MYIYIIIRPIFTNSYGPAGPWCWIDIYHVNTYTYLWTCLIYCFNWCNVIYSAYAAFTAAKYFVKRKNEIKDDKNKDEEYKFIRKYLFILRLFPAILLVTRLPALVNRVYLIITFNNNFYLYFLHTMFYSLAGLFNSLVYSYFYRNSFKCKNKKVRRQSTECSV